MLKIRRATAKDAKAIAKVHVDSWRSSYVDVIDPTYLKNLSYEQREDMWKRLITEKDESDQYWVAVDSKDGVIGFIAAGENRSEDLPAFDCEVYAIYLLEGYQRQSLGTQLMQHCFDQLKEQGFSFVLCWCFEKNTRKEFFSAIGGRIMGKRTQKTGSRNLKEIAFGWPL